ncbi:MAG: hypothetical protein Q4P15_00070 [Propionibacteriaceae bacterium]|nr:hypothetical protein [Propionibacteriaceae bacterium]
MTATALDGSPRFWMPLATSLAAAVITLLGMWQALVFGSAQGFVVWLFVPPLLMVLTVSSLVAAVRGRWRPRWSLVIALAMCAALALSFLLWCFTLPDDQLVPVGFLRGGAAAYLVLSGAAASTALAPALQRRMSGAASLVLGFTCGLVGALVVLPAIGAGVGFVIISLVLAIVTLIQWRRSTTNRPSALA